MHILYESRISMAFYSRLYGGIHVLVNAKTARL